MVVYSMTQNRIWWSKGTYSYYRFISIPKSIVILLSFRQYSLRSCHDSLWLRTQFGGMKAHIIIYPQLYDSLLKSYLLTVLDSMHYTRDYYREERDYITVLQWSQQYDSGQDLMKWGRYDIFISNSLLPYSRVILLSF